VLKGDRIRIGCPEKNYDKQIFWSEMKVFDTVYVAKVK